MTGHPGHFWICLWLVVIALSLPKNFGDIKVVLADGSSCSSVTKTKE